MKRLISLILVLVTALSLCACGGKTSKIPETLPSPDLPEDKRPTDLSYLEGTWRDLSGKNEITFDADANFVWTYLNGRVEEGQAEYWYRSEETFIDVDGASFSLEHIDGIPHLTCGDHDLVPEKDYYGPQVVRMTEENWQEYFEVKEMFFFSYNSSRVLSLNHGCAIVLKEEYAEKMNGGRANFHDHDVRFTVTFEEQMFEVVSADFENTTMTYGSRDTSVESQQKVQEYIAGYYNPETFPDRSPLLGQVGLTFSVGALERWQYEDGLRTAPKMIDFTVTQVEGYMLFEN